MKASQPRSVSSVRRTRAAGPAASEVLEGRRLFAAFGPGHGGYDHRVDAAIVIASRIPPMVSWQSQLAAFRSGQSTTTSGITTSSTTTSDSATAESVNASAVAAVTSTRSTVPVRFVSSPSTSLQARPTDIATTAAPTVIDQVMTTTTFPAVATANTHTASNGSADAAAPTFGSYTVKLANVSGGHTKTIESGLIDLLAVNAERNSRLSAWQVEAGANARRVTSAETRAEIAAAELPMINSDAVVMQAALPILPGDASMRPLWQRVALFTATGVIVTANWVIRRKQRRLAVAMKA